MLIESYEIVKRHATHIHRQSAHDRPPVAPGRRYHAEFSWHIRGRGGAAALDLATYVGIEGPSLVRLLDHLESMDLVIRKDDPTDRRAKGLWLTPEGEKLASRMEDALDELRGKILANVDPADIEAAVRVLKAFEEFEASKAVEPEPEKVL